MRTGDESVNQSRALPHQAKDLAGRCRTKLGVQTLRPDHVPHEQDVSTLTVT